MEVLGLEVIACLELLELMSFLQGPLDFHPWYQQSWCLFEVEIFSLVEVVEQLFGVAQVDQHQEGTAWVHPCSSCARASLVLWEAHFQVEFLLHSLGCCFLAVFAPFFLGCPLGVPLRELMGPQVRVEF